MGTGAHAVTATRRGDFTHQARTYARARPDYPSEMVDRLLELVSVGPGAQVADVGAGTGLFTHALAQRGLRVTAVEPNAAMRAQAPPRPQVVWCDGTFEATGLADASQAWIVAAQAFHWAEPRRALPELRRALAPGGCLTVLWNNRDPAASPVLAWTRELVQALVPGFDEGYRNRDWAAVLTSSGHFHTPTAIEVRHTISFSVARYLDLWRSHHLLNAAAGPEAMGRLLEEIAGRLESVGQVDVAYVCRAWTVRT